MTNAKRRVPRLVWFIPDYCEDASSKVSLSLFLYINHHVWKIPPLPYLDPIRILNGFLA
ncbi:MAG: hypothetical protein QXO47_06685 [Thermoproteota archaeon]